MQMLSATEYGSPTHSSKPRQTQRQFLHRIPPSSYPAHRYPSWESYSAYPPPHTLGDLFRGCNIRLDFLHDRTSETNPIPRYLLYYHYVPRVYTSDWTALQRLTAYERLLRFLSMKPISEAPNTGLGIADWLYTAKAERIDIGILDWPRGHWDSGVLKSARDYEMVEDIMKRELVELIEIERKKASRGFRWEGVERGENIEFLEKESIQDSAEESSASEADSYLDSVSSNEGSIGPDLCWGKFTPSPASELGWLDRFEELEWVESVEMNRGREGLGWWTALMSSQDLEWEKMQSYTSGLPLETLQGDTSDSETESREDISDEQLLNDFGSLDLDSDASSEWLSDLESPRSLVAATTGESLKDCFFEDRREE